MVVVADTGPINYLVLLGKVGILPKLYGQIIVPQAVFAELGNAQAPQAVQAWTIRLPNWFAVHQVGVVDSGLEELDAGEREAISLAQQMTADLLLLDDWDARQEALRRNLTVGGTLRVLEDAAQSNLLDLPEAVAQLKATNFRIKESVLQTVLARDAKRKMKSE